MSEELTVKDVREITGKSEHWLRTRTCQWCDQTALNSLRYGCGAIWEKCDPFEKRFRDVGES